MNPKSGIIDRWRKFFRGADGDIFDVLEYAILVAASDCPKEFRIRRDEIAQKLFSCRLIRCVECDSVALAEPTEDRDGGSEGCHVKESKVNSSTDDNERNRISNYSYDEAEALTEEIEEESQIVGEVLRIKEVLESPDESDASLFESLRRLQLMELSVDTLKATEIGRAVSRLKKHGSKQIRNLSKTLIGNWKDLVDEWVRTTSTVTGDSPDSLNPSTVDDDDEEGLPSPPLDEGAFLAPHTTSIELSQFFDGMDDDGNPRSGVSERDKLKENGRKSDLENNVQRRKVDLSEKDIVREEKEVIRNQEAFVDRRQMKAPHFHAPSNNSAPGRPPKPSTDIKLVTKPILQQRPSSVQATATATVSDKSKCSDDMSVRVKLEATKRKLQEGYQQAENAKKQRTIQVMELHDLPKQGLVQRHPHMKPGFHNRHWNNGRR
ncbi:probable mediator of RNA polymerase II transcription subunit 26b [Nymphaea colorata]|nr:probable mediator of RNA polymerase II transcription subunit 26b [Nymphaea colorata]